MKRYSRITGTGSFLPPRRVTNAELVARLAQQGIESSDQWIRERTGIRAPRGVRDAAPPVPERARGRPPPDPCNTGPDTPDRVFQ